MAAQWPKDPGKKQDKDKAYSAAYQIFQEGNYAKARTEFQNFLATYPNSEYSDNAQFWIGELIIFEKNMSRPFWNTKKSQKIIQRQQSALCSSETGTVFFEDWGQNQREAPAAGSH